MLAIPEAIMRRAGTLMPTNPGHETLRRSCSAPGDSMAMFRRLSMIGDPLGDKPLMMDAVKTGQA
jgi:hypothetical protein